LTIITLEKFRDMIQENQHYKTGNEREEIFQPYIFIGKYSIAMEQKQLYSHIIEIMKIKL